jgi:hypothetical protein
VLPAKAERQRCRFTKNTKKNTKITKLSSCPS